MMQTRYEDLTISMSDLDENTVQSLLEKYIKEEPENIMEMISAMNRGMAIVGQRFDEFEYFVGDLIFAGEIYSLAVEKLRPLLRHGHQESTAQYKVILCTVEGDLHNIGKTIVKYTMEAKGLTVIDLGVNVSPSRILERTLEEDASVIALSGVLGLAADSMARTIEAFRECGLRDKVRILIGGSCVTAEMAIQIGADAYSSSPEESARLCAEWLNLPQETSERK